MKRLKSPVLLICILCCFVCFLLGMYLSRNAWRKTMTVEFPEPSAMVETSVPQTGPSVSAASEPERGIPEGDSLLNINTASAAELRTLPGIGEVIAQRIVDYREENGPYHTIDELLDVEGIGEKRMEELREYITVR